MAEVLYKWTCTVAALKAEGANVVGICDKCEAHHPADLDKIEAKHGPFYSLWNRRPPCPKKGCPGRLAFSAQRPDSGWWPTRMRTDNPSQTAELHRIWKAEREAVRRRDLAISWIRKHRKRRREIGLAAAKLIEQLGPDGAIERACEDISAFPLPDFALAERIDIFHEVVRLLHHPGPDPDLDESL